MMPFATPAEFGERRSAALCVLNDSDCMVATLVSHLAAHSAERLAEITVVLPTQRLCTAFLARLARQFGACFAPLTLTLEQFVTSLMPIDAPPLVHETELVLIVRALVAARQTRHVKEKHARELVLFFEEIDEQGEGVEAFVKLKKFWLEDPYHHEHHVGSIIDRIDEMQQLYDELHRTLEQTRRTTMVRLLRSSGEVFAQRLATTGVLPEAKAASLHIAAFTSLSPALGPILDRLCGHPGVNFWLSAPPELYAAINPIKDLTAELIRRGARLKRPSSPPSIQGLLAPQIAAHQTLILRCASRLDEVEAVLDHYEQLVAVGVTPSQIAILVTHETIYGPLLRAAMARRSIEANLAITQPLNETAFGLWLEALSHFVKSGEGLTQLMALVGSPITSHFMVASLAGLEAFKEKGPCSPTELTVRLMELGGQFKAVCGLDSFIAECDDTIVRAALTMLRDALMPLGKAVGRTLLLGDWLAILCELCTVFAPLTFIEEEDIALSAEQAWQRFKEALTFVARHTTMQLSLQDFFLVVDEQLGGCDVRQTGEPLRGLQVLSLAQARYMPFHCAMILGCNEGIFPQALPKDELIDDFLKRQIDLPGWRALEAREDLTFLLLRARLALLVLTYAAADIDEPLVRSRFIEKLVSEEALVPQAYAGRASAAAIKIEPSLGEGQQWLEGQFPGPPGELLREFSASSLTCLMRCPYQFLLHKLGIKELAFARMNEQGIKEGILLHQILETFFTGKVEKTQVAEPWPLALTDSSFKAYALGRLERLTRLLGGEAFTLTPLCAHLFITGWPAFADHLTRLYGPENYHMIATAKKECDIGTEITLPFTHDEIAAERRLHGRIDSIDEVPELALITDYKRSRVPGQRECADGSAPQLLFYHLALTHSDHGRDPGDYLLGYYSIIEGKWYPRGVGDNVLGSAKQRNLVGAKTPSTSEIQEASLQLWQLREAVILREKRFFADPQQCELCPYTGLCRKEQAGIKERFRQQSLWSGPLLEKEGET